MGTYLPLLTTTTTATTATPTTAATTITVTGFVNGLVTTTTDYASINLTQVITACLTQMIPTLLTYYIITIVTSRTQSTILTFMFMYTTYYSNIIIIIINTA